jgi:flagellar hook-length control protein FliK
VGSGDTPATSDSSGQPSTEHRARAKAQATSPALDRLRAASQASARAEAAGADGVPAPPPAVVVPVVVSDAPAPPSHSSSTQIAVAALVQGVSMSPQGQRGPADSGDALPGFAFSGHATPRLSAATMVAPPVPTFATLLNAAHAPDAVPAGTTTQIVQAIRMQLLRDGGEAHIRLDPRQFGDMTVRIKVDQGQVTARVEADTPVVREWLQSNQHVLRQSLAGQQLTLDRLEVHEPPASSQGRRDDSPGRDEAREDRRQQRRRRPETGALFEVVA